MKKVFTMMYPAFVMLFIMAMYLPASAQYTQKDYVDNIGASAMCKDAAGNVYVLRSATAFQNTTAGVAEVVEYKINGTVTVLNSNIGANEGTDGGYESGTGIAVDGNGNVYVSSFFDGGTNYGKILKLTAASGYATVSTFYAGTSNTFAYFGGLVIDSHNNLYATAYDWAGNGGAGTYDLLELPNVLNSASFAGSPTKISTHIGDVEQTAYNVNNFQGSYTPYAAIAIDGSDNIFLAAAYGYLGTTGTDGGILYKFPNTGNGTFGAPIPLKSNFYGSSLGVDPTGNLYAVVLSGAPSDLLSAKLVNYGNSTTGTNTGTSLAAGTNISTALGQGVEILCWGIAAVSSSNIYVINGEVLNSGNQGDIYQFFGIPGTQATNVTFSNTASTSATASWTNGNGTSRAVFIKQTNTGSPAPVNSTSYAANANYGSGNQIGGTGWYCIYNGTGTTVNITGLTTGQTYRVMAVEYNGSAGSENYLQTTGTNNPNNVTALAGETITFNALPTKTYGNADFAPGATSTNGSVTITYASDNTAVATIVSGNIHIVGQGTAHITASQAGDASHTAAADVIQLLTVNKAALTITANNQTKAYGAAMPTLTASYTGFVNGETSAVLTTGPTFSTAATAASHVAGSPYAITPSGAVAANYTISYVAGSLTVTTAPLTITADNQTKIYGAPLPTLTASFTGFVNGDTGGSLTTQPTLTTTATAASHVAGSPYTISASGAVDADYTISYAAGSITVTTAPLTVTADNQTKVYGAPLPTLTASFTGLVNGDTGGSLTTQPTLATTATAASTVAGNPYSITASGAVDADYTISYVAGSLNVTAAPLTITANNQTKAYGAPLPTLTASFTGLVNGDTGGSLTTQPTLSTTATAASHVAGSPYTISASGAVDPNYTISYVAGSLTVTTAPLTITADNQTKIYGAPLPTLTASFTGLVNGDTGGSLTTQPTLTTTATAASHVAGSPYAISASGAVDADYTISYVAGSLTVTTAPLTVTADNQTKVYGAPLPTLTASFTGLVNGDTGGSLTTQPTLATTATAASHVAGNPYSITASGAADADYTISYVAGTLTITVAPLTITADNQTKAYGAALPVLTASYNGFVNGDSESSLTSRALLGTTATAASHAAGNPYPIIASRALSADYSITYVAGSLTISSVPLTITANNQTKTYGAANPTLTASYSGFVNGDTKANLTPQPTLSTTATAASHVAGNPYPITASGAVNGDYTFSYMPGTLTINKAPLTILADNKTKTYGAPMPILTASYGGFVNGDTQADLTTQPALNTVATASSPIGVYTITIGGATAADYSINQVSGSIAIVASSDATLSSITLSKGTLSPAFQSSNTSYNVYLPNATTSTTITAALSIAGATMQVRINGGAYTPLSSGIASGSLTLNSGNNPIDIMVTAIDGTVKTYTVTVNSKPPLNNVVLSSLITNPGISLYTVSGPDYVDYAGSAFNSVSSVTFIPTTADATNTIKVNGVAVVSGTASASIPLSVGDNTITTVVTSHDGTISNTYSTKITRLAVASLASIALSPNTLLNTVTGPDFKDYTASVPFSVSSVTVTPRAADVTNSITVNGVVVTSGTASVSIPLNVGDNTITTVVTTQDGVTSNTYSIKITRGTVASLTNIAVSPGTPLYTVAGPDFKDYAAFVYNVSAVTIIPTSADPTNTITVNGVPVVSGTASSSIPLNVGDNIITTVVTAQDRLTTNTYSIKITRQAVASLASIVVNPNVAFSTGTGTDFKDYTASVPFSVSSVTVTPRAIDVTNIITVNGVVVASGTTSAAIPLNVGDNIINTIVTTQDGVTSNTYSIKITRGALATLASIALSPSTSLPVVTGPDFKDYTAYVINSVSSVKVIPTTADATNTIKVNGVPVVSGSASASIPLNVGDNTITTIVTSYDGTISNTYSIKITRAASATLASIALSPNVPFNTVSGPDFKDYTASEPFSVSSVTVTPRAVDITNIITVNGVVVTSGTASASIPLNVGDNMITTVVYTYDGVTANTYSIKVTRLAPTPVTSLYDEKLVAVVPPVRNPELVVHQNVSPNGDGRSDVLVIDGITTYPENTLQIMNRSGSLVYEAKGYDNTTKAFDGHANNGKLQQAGTYFYSLEYKDGKETKRKTGFIVLKY